MIELEKLQAENAQLLAECQQLKAHNRQLVAALESINQLATEKRKAHSGPCGQDSLSMERNRAAYQQATEFKKVALVTLQTPPAKLALAEAEVLQLLPTYLQASKMQDYGEYFNEFLETQFNPAVEAMQEAKNGSNT